MLPACRLLTARCRQSGGRRVQSILSMDVLASLSPRCARDLTSKFVAREGPAPGFDQAGEGRFVRKHIRRVESTDPHGDFLNDSRELFERVERGVADMVRHIIHGVARHADCSVDQPNLALLTAIVGSLSCYPWWQAKLNKPFAVKKSDDDMELTIDLGSSKGELILKRDWQNCEVVYQSPVSNVHTYRSTEGTHGQRGKVWRSIADNHDLLGIITRDLLRLATGCPSF